MSGTEFVHVISMLVPPARYAAAGTIIACISENPADLMQFGRPKFGTYDACNVQAKESHAQALRAAAAGVLVLQRPAFDTDSLIDMAAVNDAKAKTTYVFSLPEGQQTPVPDQIIIGLDIDAATLASLYGLKRAIEE